VPLLNYTLAFDFQLRKVTETLSQRSRIVLDTNRCVYFTALLGADSTGPMGMRHPWLIVGDFSQPLVGISAFQIS
jgi:hypothetical protein